MTTDDREREYLEAFNHCVRPRFKTLPEHERLSRDHRRGDLVPSATGKGGIHDTHNYQRSHADAFIAACREFDLAPPTERTMVIDLGAGAATVAVSLAEFWGSRIQHVDYVGIEPDSAMRQLGNCMLDALNDPWRSATVRPTFASLETTDHDRILVSMSYLVHQSSITSADLAEWGGMVSRCARTCRTEILITTVNLNNEKFRRLDTTSRFLDCLRDYGLDVLPQQTTLQVMNRFPSTDDTWEIVRPGKTPGYRNVVVRHWQIGNRD